MVAILRGEIYMAELDGVGSEQTGFRPVLIVQNNTGNHYAPTTIVVPITTVVKRNLPTHHLLTAAGTGLLEDSIAFCEQVRTIDKSRLGDKVGIATVFDMKVIDLRMSVSLGMLSIRDFHQKLDSLGVKIKA